MALPAATFFSADSAEITPDIEGDFFGSLKLSNQTFKTTNVNRFEGLNDELIRLITESGSAIARVLDVGVSSGVTTIELLRAFRAVGVSPEVTATDLVVEAYIVPLWRACRALVEEGGFPLQYELFGMVVRPWRRRRDLLNGMIAVRWLVNRVCAPRAHQALQRGKGIRSVQLISPRLVSDPRAKVMSDDVLKRNPGLVARFDFVRAANILNLHYFDESQLQSAIDNLKSYMAGPGSLLLILRTRGQGDQHGTLFQLAESGRLRIVRRFGNGSEVEHLVGAVNDVDASPHPETVP